MNKFITVLGLFILCILASFGLVFIGKWNELKQGSLEIYTPYDILYLEKEKGVWVVSSEVEPFHKVVTYPEGLKLIEALSAIDTDMYWSYIESPEKFDQERVNEVREIITEWKKYEENE